MGLSGTQAEFWLLKLFEPVRSLGEALVCPWWIEWGESGPRHIGVGEVL